MEAGFAAADHILVRDYTTQRQERMPIEPEAVVAVPEFQSMVVCAPTNSAYNVRQTVCETLGLPENQVSLRIPTIGGSFGGKNYDLAVMASRAAVAAVVTGKLVRLVCTREESILEGTKRHPYRCHYKVGYKNDGTLTAIQVTILGDSGAYTSKSHPVATRSAIESCGPYVVPNTHTDLTFAYTNNLYSDSMRGFGSPQVDFSCELIMDEVARELGMDPMEFRKKNHIRENDISAVGQTMTCVSLDKCLEKADEEFGWNTRRARAAESRRSNKGLGKVRGVGMALLHRGEAFGAAGQGLDTSAVSRLTNWDGSIVILTSVSEVGMGCHTMLVNVLCETLGVHRERVVVCPVDTNYVPNSGATVATRTTVVVGNAMRNAAQQVRDKMSAVAAEELGVSADCLEFRDEKVYDPAHPEKYVTYLHLVQELHARAQNAYGHGWYAVAGLKYDRANGSGEAYQSYAYGVCMAEVEVDLAAGQVSVEKFVAAHDVGHAFDREEVIGQIKGGVSRGRCHKKTWRNPVKSMFFKGSGKRGGANK
ncbi:molybdopterin cofactor-binding domain-containing protein [Pseudoflavonifractor sp. 524-17]|uniref:molybdopterin cofactor-binding domain-containing protein n=1 Tax=Pseudoflavonifractor sp. 524-17 TaxID=2304577 RepID=UPI0013799C74